MATDADQGGEAPCWAHLVDDLDPPASAPPIRSSNTILYCDAWLDVVAFYRDRLGLRTTMERDWFVEFELHPGARVSVADASRATVAAGTGQGVTLSVGVDDIAAARAWLHSTGIDVPAPTMRWGAHQFFIHDPAGNRIEFWSPLPDPS
ncbi:VOC family protein [Ilumatobacter coccineus]|uniref:VOC domain-containing protein n=1 Tax=Ilumatobacter coccineus (strain NBRC 103263 / KCTC 29153 / YM16-304) TaxID=1313172 RepID=A0A6C7EGV0_ILUCY|nr:VOC family protein [Ilumatobacter coccineus]BAN04369.1 hypothetical protein YM304_40550 [Ilumatobacter coccineus YM16-304]